jgi:phytoene dehydrogenase-like protein
VVIGSGIGGLACAGALAARGRAVVVLEQGGSPGGYLSSFRRQGFTFDSGVDCIAGLDANGLLTRLLESLGMAERLVAVRLDPIRISRFPGLTVRVDASLPAYLERLCRLFPAERRGMEAFFRRAEEIYSDIAIMMETAASPRRSGAAPSGALLRYGPLTYAELLRLDIRDARLAAVLSDRCPFLGVAPRRASATRMVALMMSYFRSGAYRPRGGHQQLANLLVEGIRRAGGDVHLGRAATAIRLTGDRCDRVLTADGAELPADHVVSNADVAETFGRLIGGDLGAAVLAEVGARPLSPSFFVAYAGLSKGEPPPASSIGSFPGFDLDGALGRYDPFVNAEPLGITIPTLEDPTLAPPEHDVCIVHELIPPRYACAWERESDGHLRGLLERSARVIPGLLERLVHSEAATPATLERYTRNRRGAAYGWEQTPHLARVRHGIRNLHLAGHWAETGGGVLAAAFSGIRVAARISRDDA